MTAFGLSLTFFLLLLPAVTSLLVKAKPSEHYDPDLDRKLTKALWLWTGVALLVTAALAGLEAAGWMDWYYELPFIMTFHKSPAEVMFVASFPLWVLTSKLLNNRRADFTPPQPKVKRTASLTSRQAQSPIPVQLWAVPWLIWCATNVVHQLEGDGLQGAQHTTVVLLILIQVPMLAFGPSIPRYVLREPEPLPEGHHPEVEAAYQRLRNQRIWGFYGLAVAMTVLWCGIILAITLMPTDNRTLGLIGGIAGSAVGIAGGIFGAWMGMSRARLNARVAELTQETS